MTRLELAPISHVPSGPAAAEGGRGHWACRKGNNVHATTRPTENSRGKFDALLDR